MKRLIYITYLSLLVLILASCQKENLAPAGVPAEENTDNLKQGKSCRQYSYFTKFDHIQMGSARADYITVGFANHLPAVQQRAILSQYPIFDRLDGDFPLESGLITFVKLKPTATCLSVEQMINSLENHKKVKFALPVFDDPDKLSLYWALSNEIIVELKDPAYYPKFKLWTKLTGTEIVENLGNMYLLVSTNKYSLGNALELSSLFNTSHFVDAAGPNFIWGPSVDLPVRQSQSSKLKALKPADAAL